MRSRLLSAAISALAAGGVLAPAPAPAATPQAGAATSAGPTGLWDATVTVRGAAIPFRLQFDRSQGEIQATFFDGDRPVRASQDGAFSDGHLVVRFPSYASRLDARLEGGVLRGTLGDLPFEARPHAKPAAGRKAAPPIGGVWIIPTSTQKGEKAWRLIVRQTPERTYASILRIDGDTGTIDGTYTDGAFRLSRFAGERPTALTLTPQADGTLALSLTDFSGRRDFKAIRPVAAQRAGVAAPEDPTKFTGVKDRTEAFRFSGTDLSGRQVDQADAKFRGKVVLVNVMGSWCPNCHDEAPFLAELDARYRARGLEVVGLDFESGEELKTLSRLKAFIARYNLRYSVLVAGDRAQVTQALPQAVNLNAWPTTFFLDRKGRVHSVHVGFPSRGSGPYERKAREDITREIEGLLAQKG